MKKLLKYSLAVILVICMSINMIPAMVVNAAGGEYMAKYIVDGKLVELTYSVDQKVKAPQGPFLEGYTFWGWVTDWLDVYDEDDIITLTGDTTFYGVYDYNSYDVKLSSSSSEHATVTGIPNTGKYLDDYKFTVQPDDGYEIVSITASYWRNTVPVSKIDENKYSFVVPSGDVTVNVITREADSYTIKVDNGTASTNVKRVSGKTYTLPSTLNSSVTVPENSVWVGWKDADTSLVYAAGTVITANKNYRFVPAFNAVSPKEYTGTFCSDGMLVSVLTTENQTITAPKAPKKEGYTFTYWSCDNSQGTYAVGDTITLDSNALFTANYAVNSYKVTLDGDTSANATVKGVPSVGNTGEQVKFTAAAKIGYEIAIIFATDGASNIIPVCQLGTNQYAFTMPASDVSVKIVTREAESYTIKVTNGTASEKVKRLSGKTYTLPSTLNDSVKVPKDSVWIGWKDADTSSVYAAGAVITANKNYRFVPAFNAVPAQEYVGTFYSNGMLVSVLTTKNQKLTVPAAPAKDGFTFKSWSSENPLGKYAVGSTVTLTSDAVFTANYSVNNHKITLNGNFSSSASVSGMPSSVDVGKLVNFTTAAKNGHIITGVKVINEKTKELVSVHSGATNEVNGAAYYFTMPDAPVSIKVDTLKDDYNVIYINDNGAFVSGEEIAYNQSAHVSLSTVGVDANKEGYHFVGWTSADTQTPVTSPSVTDTDFVVVKNTYIKAVFEKDEIDVHFMPTKHGTVTELTTGKAGENILNTTVFGDTVSFTVDPDEGYEIDTVSLSTIGRDGNPMMITPMVVGNTYSFVIPATYKDDASKAQASDIEVSVNFKKSAEELIPQAEDGSNQMALVIGLAAAASGISLIALILAILARRKRNTDN